MGGLFSSPKSPTVETPAPMPTEDAEQIEAAKKKKAAEIQSRSGRSSTILTRSSDKLGG